MFLCPNVSKHIITSSLKVKMQRLPFKHCGANSIRKSSLHPFTSYQHLSTFIFLFVCRSEQCVHFTFSTFSACMDTDLHIHSLHLRNLTFFSFFSELHHSNQVATTIMETAAISAVFLVSVAANAGAAVLVTCGRRLLANKTILTLNLFVADLLFVSMIPLIVTVRWTVSWELGAGVCSLPHIALCHLYEWLCRHHNLGHDQCGESPGYSPAADCAKSGSQDGDCDPRLHLGFLCTHLPPPQSVLHCDGSGFPKAGMDEFKKEEIFLQ